VVALLFIGCNKDEIGPQIAESPLPEEAQDERRVWVLNEGLFNFGNASISICDAAGQVLENNAYSSRNGEPLGDILQSAAVEEDKVYLVLNNSGKVVVVDKMLNKLSEITGFESPRYWLDISPETALVSDLYSDQIAIVDKNAGSIIGQINTGICDSKRTYCQYTGHRSYWLGH